MKFKVGDRVKWIIEKIDSEIYTISRIFDDNCYEIKSIDGYSILKSSSNTFTKDELQHVIPQEVRELEIFKVFNEVNDD